VLLPNGIFQGLPNMLLPYHILKTDRPVLASGNHKLTHKLILEKI
jgi:hypothetical protein